MNKILLVIIVGMFLCLPYSFIEEPDDNDRYPVYPWGSRPHQ
jgi:hypothetical protein